MTSYYFFNKPHIELALKKSKLKVKMQYKSSVFKGKCLKKKLRNVTSFFCEKIQDVNLLS